MSSPSPALTAKQTAALFNILTHHETYDEIEALKQPDTIFSYGHPFTSEAPVATSSPKGSSRNSSRSNSKMSAKSTSTSPSGSIKSAKSAKTSTDSIAASPVLQTLLRRFLLTLPGLRDLPEDFWSVRVQGLLTRLAAADLSESYDKGAMGTRKTLATAFSAMVESLVRGCLGGCPPSRGAGDKKERYDLKDAKELERAFNDVLYGVVYGDLIDDITVHVEKSADLEAHSPRIAAAVEYVILHLATLFHQVFILSPEGEYLRKLIESVHGMLPYAVIRQTLRMSNAATMMSGMLKLFLSKLSLGGFSNYIGLTKNANDGMNLLQRIISVVTGWDSAEFKKMLDKIEKSEHAPNSDVLAALKAHAKASASVRASARNESQKSSKSIITIILNRSDPALAKKLSAEQHAQCQEYYAALLSIRDRDELTTALCTQSPDLFTQTVRDLVGGFEPYIRAIHDKIDLREHVQDYQSFVDQFIATSKPQPTGSAGTETRLPSVEDYVALLRKNRHMLYRWMHHGAAQAPEVRNVFKAWAKEAVVHFRKPGVEVAVPGSSAHVEGSMVESVADAFAALSDEVRGPLLPVIDAHASHLDALEALSVGRMQQIIDGGSSTMAGPGIFLVSWQELLDSTLITPATPDGAARRGKDVQNKTVEGKPGATDDAGETKADKETRREGEEARKKVLGSLPEGPDVKPVVEVMGAVFRKLIADAEGGGDSGSDISID
ncbi:hypothetical protein VD0004_g9135 [Verticillium dahliae]|uniref:PX domain-containing protein n=1 Tax=Verticillium dahliae TaxID=27337 RepID=A0A444RYH8_VERDA|nr:hypothetical protein VD0004_g9135 [Verticillium dahliae]PNH63347.1 hypothetical protein VD0001_g9173 [Verticillium dahliae]RXG46159.1 hypothetical protein VDGE_03401 [Verticillium dahliae]